MNEYDKLSTERLFGIARARMQRVVEDCEQTADMAEAMLPEIDVEDGLRLLQVQDSSNANLGLMAFAVSVLEGTYADWKAGVRDEASVRESLMRLLLGGDAQ